MPDQPKFCVVETELSLDAGIAFAEVWFSKRRGYEDLDQDWYDALLAARGPEAEAMCAVPRALLRRLYPGADGPIITDAQLVDRHEALKELRTFLNPAKE